MAIRTLGTNRRTARAAAESPLSRPANKQANRNVERAQCWMLTLNFGDSDEIDRMSERATIALRRFNAAAQVSPCTYCVFQPEKGENGRLHIQGYAEFEKKMSLAAVRKHFGDSVYAEVRQGTQAQAIAYCTKETDLDADPPIYGRVEGGEVVEFGEKMKANEKGGTRGSRNDWRGVWNMIKERKAQTEIVEAFPMVIPYSKAVNYARFLVQCERVRETPTELVILYGDTDCGKTSAAIAMCTPGRYYVIGADGKSMWWDGYDPDQHDTVILDEFVGSRCPITHLNQLCDKIMLNVQTKGGFVNFLAKRLIITSNFAPEEWYKNVPESKVEALMRRVTLLCKFSVVREVSPIVGDEPPMVTRLLNVECLKGQANLFFFAQHSRYLPCRDMLKRMEEQSLDCSDCDEELAQSELDAMIVDDSSYEDHDSPLDRELGPVAEDSSEQSDSDVVVNYGSLGLKRSGALPPRVRGLDLSDSDSE